MIDINQYVLSLGFNLIVITDAVGNHLKIDVLMRMCFLYFVLQYEAEWHASW